MADPQGPRNHSPYSVAEGAREARRLAEALTRLPRRQALHAAADAHEEAFEALDCLECGNCCRNYSPRFKSTDITRLARALNLKQGVLIETYLRLDEDGDYVTRSQPCPFLDTADNRCRIYEDRPGDCRRYPYTDSDEILARPALTATNLRTCPIAWRVALALTKVPIK